MIVIKKKMCQTSCFFTRKPIRWFWRRRWAASLVDVEWCRLCSDWRKLEGSQLNGKLWHVVFHTRSRRTGVFELFDMVCYWHLMKPNWQTYFSDRLNPPRKLKHCTLHGIWLESVYKFGLVTPLHSRYLEMLHFRVVRWQGWTRHITNTHWCRWFSIGFLPSRFTVHGGFGVPHSSV